MAVETPSYTVVDKDGKFEVRDYTSYVTAEVEVPGSYNSALLKGFRILADYIFGNNRSKQQIAMTAPVMQESAASEKIAMTSPVITQKSGSGNYLVSFIMPEKYSLDNLPEPVSENIRFKTVEGQRTAVISFSGYLNSRIAERKKKELQKWMRSKGINALGNYVSCQYNPPWIPGFLRKNEVMVTVEPAQAKSING